jgi:hypothetical protein
MPKKPPLRVTKGGFVLQNMVLVVSKSVTDHHVEHRPRIAHNNLV